MKEFKKDTHIVILQLSEFGTDSYFEDTVYKQREDYEKLRTYLDSKGSIINGWNWINANEHEGQRWRYATQEEAAHYEVIGKPYCITDLPPNLTALIDDLDTKIVQMERRQNHG